MDQKLCYKFNGRHNAIEQSWAAEPKRHHRNLRLWTNILAESTRKDTAPLLSPQRKFRSTEPNPQDCLYGVRRTSAQDCFCYKNNLVSLWIWVYLGLRAEPKTMHSHKANIVPHRSNVFWFDRLNIPFMGMHWFVSELFLWRHRWCMNKKNPQKPYQKQRLKTIFWKTPFSTMPSTRFERHRSTTVDGVEIRFVGSEPVEIRFMGKRKRVWSDCRLGRTIYQRKNTGARAQTVPINRISTHHRRTLLAGSRWNGEFVLLVGAAGSAPGTVLWAHQRHLKMLSKNPKSLINILEQKVW